MDMVRCKYIVRAYQEFGVLENVQRMSRRLMTGLHRLPSLLNVRSAGLLAAFDLETPVLRDRFVRSLWKDQMICNPTLTHTVRLRPNLAVTADEVDRALEIMSRAASA
jgi:4-aminobutyrate aminotransferase-like enzyme